MSPDNTPPIPGITDSPARPAPYIEPEYRASAFHAAAAMRPRTRIGRHLLFFLVTAWTMTINGAWLSPVVLADPGGLSSAFDLTFLARGIPYALALMAILGVHELGHYVACRIYGVDASLPWFLPGPPAPIGLFGTFGAFIRIRSAFPDRNALFDVGIAGPIAGFLVAVPVMAWGMSSSDVVPITGELTRVDVPLLWHLIDFWLEAPPEGHARLLSGPLMAGWVGCLATALNLLPIGQLDGGHVCYAVSAPFHRFVSFGALLGFISLGLFLYPGWIFFAMLLILFSPRHPPVMDESVILTPGRRVVAVVGLLLLVLCFIPRPIRF